MCTLLNCIMSLFSFGRARPGMPQFGWPWPNLWSSVWIGHGFCHESFLHWPSGGRLATDLCRKPKIQYIYITGGLKIQYIIYYMNTETGGLMSILRLVHRRKMNNSNMLTARGDRQTKRVPNICNHRLGSSLYIHFFHHPVSHENTPIPSSIPLWGIIIFNNPD
jgi:hypothetical protein